MVRVMYLFPDREQPGEHEEPKPKWLVILRCDEAEPDVTFLIASSKRHDHAATRRYEVLVTANDGGGFVHDTLVDCRWPNTLPRAWFADAEEMGRLPRGMMEEVGKALVYGLRLHDLAKKGRR